jgi:RNA polymerase sigma factor (sigma-70 family)
LRGFCAGNEECARRFVDRFWRRLYWIAFRIVGDPESAKDVVQITFERSWRNGVTFDPGRGSLDGWVATIARNAALDWMRMKRTVLIDASVASVDPASESCDPEGSTLIEETRTDVRSALDSLPPKLARSVVLAGAFDMTAAEVAHHEHIPLGTAKSRIRAAKERLRRELNPTNDHPLA